MPTLDDLVRQADELVAFAGTALSRQRTTHFGQSVSREDFGQLRSASMAFIERVFGKDHSYYREFDANVKDTSTYYVQHALGILTAIRGDLAGGWIRTTRGLVSAEVFADFLEMAEHLLSESYKDPAAVMGGSVLEEHLRQMAPKYGVATEYTKDGRVLPRKADSLNADLAKAGAYSTLDLKGITSWLGLRNSAAHGHYNDYTPEQVGLLLAGARDFIARHPL